MSESSSLTIPSLRATGNKDKIFVSTSFLRKTKDKVVPVRAIRACGGVKVKIPAIIANDLSFHGPTTSL